MNIRLSDYHGTLFDMTLLSDGENIGKFSCYVNYFITTNIHGPDRGVRRSFPIERVAASQNLRMLCFRKKQMMTKEAAYLKSPERN
jgi:hypothetical protein